MPDLDIDAKSPSLANGLWSEVDDAGLLELLAAAPMPNLGVGPTCVATAKRIETWSATGPHRDPLVLAGLWLLAGELERSHAISQQSKSADGAVWHGIMHRREGDFWNAKYWFRQADKHQVYDALRQFLESGQVLALPHSVRLALVGDRNLGESLVDCVESAVEGTVPDLQQVCWLEWQLMMLHQLRVRL